MDAPGDVVRSFCAAISTRDIEVVAGFFSDDAVYHNIPLDPCVGHDAVLAALDEQFQMFSSIDFRIVYLAVDGGVVLTERVDVVRLGDTEAAIPVMGTFEVRAGRIDRWRDYFDVNQVGALLSPSGATA